MTFIKRILRSFILTALALFMLLNSQPSKAAVGFVFGGAGLVTAGLYAIGGGTASATLGGVACLTGIDRTGSSTGPGCAASLFAVIGGVLAGAIGLIILEEESVVQFSPLDQKEARRLKVTKSEREAFNREVDEVNALASYVDRRLQVSEDPKVEDAKALWEEVRESVSEETFSVLIKISNELYKN